LVCGGKDDAGMRKMACQRKLLHCFIA